MARFTLITFDRYDAHASVVEYFDVEETEVSVDLFKKCLLKSFDDDIEERDDIFGYNTPTLNEKKQLVGMDEDELSYLFFRS